MSEKRIYTQEDEAYDAKSEKVQRLYEKLRLDIPDKIYRLKDKKAETITDVRYREKEIKKLVAEWVETKDKFKRLSGEDPPIPKECEPCINSEKRPKVLKENPRQKKLRPNQRHKQVARKVVKELWTKDPDMTKNDMARCDEIQELFEGRVYADSTIEKWIADLNPNRSPGRRPKKA